MIDERTVLTHWAPVSRRVRKSVEFRAYRAANLPRILAKQSEWREKNREKDRQRHADYYERNREAVKARERARYERNREANKRRMRERYKANRERRCAKERARYAAGRLLRAALDLLGPPILRRVAVEANCPRAQLSAPTLGVLRATPSYLA